MEIETRSVEMFFFPFIGAGHQIPMIDTARVFASHGATSTIIAAPSHALRFKNSITRDQQSGLPIAIHTLSADIPDTDVSTAPFIDTSALLEPLRQFLLRHRPDCVIVDMFYRWAGDVVDDLGIARIIFTGNGCFPRCVHENIISHVVLENLISDSESFLVPNLPDRVEMTRSQLSVFVRNPSQFPEKQNWLKQLEEKSFGTVTNSFYDLEAAYADFIRKGMKTWLVGPVSLYNRSAVDKTERGKAPTIDERKCLNWLDSKKPNSVLYLSFGSLVRLPLEQVREIAYGLEASEQSFIWVVGKILNEEDEENGSGNWLPEGFEQRMKESGKGLVLRGWAPQLLILEHAAIRGFMTHCGWNSTMEGVSAGVPMITWPLTAEQYYNEKLITDVLRIGVQVGSKEWVWWNSEWEVLVGREKVELAVRKLMLESEEAEEMRKKVIDVAGKARRAVEKGGTSYADTEALIQELKARRLATQV